MKRLLTFALVLILTASTCLAYSVPDSTIVYVTPSGAKYHRENCSYTTAVRSITILAAENQGYTACSRCRPDILSGAYESDWDGDSGGSGSSSSGGGSGSSGISDEEHAEYIFISGLQEVFTVGDTLELQASIYPFSSDNAIHWTLNKTGVISLEKTKKFTVELTALAPGKVEITATTKGGSYRTFTITVYPAPEPSPSASIANLNGADTEEQPSETETHEPPTLQAAALLALLGYIVYRFIRRRQRKKDELVRRVLAEHEAERLRQMYLSLYGKKSAKELAEMPKNVEIGPDGLPRDINSSDRWGESFTFYVSMSGQAYHCKRGCSGAYISTHACRIRGRRPCKRCRPSLPDLKWYEEYLKIKRIKEEYSITDVAEETGEYWTTICVGLDEYSNPVCKTVYANNPEELNRKINKELDK